MSDVNTYPDENNKNNEIVVSNSEGAISENQWIVGVSKTHPGLKYYFNTVTGVSLWNISREDMERAKQTMRVNGNQMQYINCPEPMDPPPSKRTSKNLFPQKFCEHILRHSKSNSKHTVISGLTRDSSALTCDVCYTSVNTPSNVITVNFQPCSHSLCISPLDNTCGSMAQSQTPPPTDLLDATNLENNYFNTNLNHLVENRRSQNRNISEINQDSNIEQLDDRRNLDTEFWNHNRSYFDSLDLTPLKFFAKSGVLNAKWYIIADANVYLHHIYFLKSLVNADSQCSLMVPQNVKVDLENATKTELRTKAHCANYYIYKMFDDGLALIDEDSSGYVKDKSNDECILDSCSKLNLQNFYVVVLSDDLELQKYRYKINIPIFRVSELKEYLSKYNHSLLNKVNTLQSNKNIETSTLNINKSQLSPQVKRNRNVEISVVRNDKGSEAQRLKGESKKTVDTEVQTDITLIQLEEMEKVYNKTRQKNQNDNDNKDKEIPMNLSCEPLVDSVHGPSKRIKLRRKKICDQIERNSSLKLFSISENPIDNLFLNNNLHDQNKKKSNTISGIRNLISNENNTQSKSKSKSKSENIDNSNVMFEVTTDIMDKNLRTKCDEWVSRFVQVMEEALTQVLGKHSSVYLPPPWNMYEATMCVEKTFKDDQDIVDASNKLLLALNQIKDEKGNINANISPTQYMEMYSFGVYLIDALQGIFSTCEDLQTAAESLSKLLSDIQDPEEDISNLECFHSTSHEDHPTNNIENANDKVEVFMIVETDSLSGERPTSDSECRPNLNEAATNKSKESPKGSSENSPSKYNLRSTRMKTLLEKQDGQFMSQETKVGESNNICKSKFLSILLLQENKEEESSPNNETYFSNNITTHDLSKDAKCSRTLTENEGCFYQFNSNETSDVPHIPNANSGEPKIVRNFVLCSEFEDRIRTRGVCDEWEELDFEDDLMTADCMDDGEVSDDPERLYMSDDTAFDQHMDQEITRNTENINIDFNYFIRRIAQEIQELSSEVYAFSQNSYETLNSLPNTHEKSSIREKAGKVHLCIDKLCTELTNILSRGKNGGYNMQGILENTEFGGILIDKDQMETYGTFIARCLEHADDLKNTVIDVLSAVC